MVALFQIVLMRLALCGLAASLILLVLRSRIARDTFARLLSIWRSLTAFGRVAVCSFLLIGILVGGDKTNGVPPNMNSPLPQMQQGGIFLTGLTGLSGTLPHTPSSLNPVNLVNPVKNNFAQRKSANWNIRGAWKDSFWLPFDDDWVFPWGTNHLSGVEVASYGQIWVTPFNTNAVASAGVPFEIVRGLTTFGCEFTSSNSYRFVWTDAAINRDTNNLVSAALELFRDGDVSVSTNGVATHLPRELPFPHDGFGQDAEWVAANFTNATEILAVGYPQWVDAQVGEGLTNGLYKFTATIPDDPPETIQLVVGDYSVAVTNSGEYVFLLEKGIDYEYGIIPFMTNVTYSAVDDVPQMRGGAGWLRSLPSDAAHTWTVDGGYGNEPQTEYAFGYVWWLPFFFGSPDVSHIGPEDDELTFTANFVDCRQLPVASYLWSGSDGLTVHSPNAQTTQITVDSMPSWAQANISVTATIGDHELYSYLDGFTYGTNATPQVFLGINAPQAIFINDDGDVAGVGKDYEISGVHVDDDDIIPIVITLHSDVPTNGTITVRPIIRDGHLWKDENRVNEIILDEHVPVSNITDFAIIYFLECEYPSYQYKSDHIQVVWTDDTGHSQQIVHDFSAIDCVAEPITSDRVVSEGVQHVVNPCCAIIGSNTFMRVRVAPNDIPNDRITWSVVREAQGFQGVLGTASFPNGDTGRDVVVVASGEENDTIILEVDVDGCPGRKPRFELLATCMTEVLIYPYLIVGDSGAELSQEQLNQKLEVVNMIYRQVGLHFNSAPIQTIDNYKWSRFGLAVRAIGRAIRDHEHKTDGVEVYFIGGSADIVDYDCRALGRANSDGVVVACNSSGRVLAHEIGHVCCLADIYIDKECQEQYSPLRRTWMPNDWNNGTGSRYYEPGKCPLDLLPHILMFGVENDVHIDIPRGSVRGMVDDKTSSTGRSLGQGAVGRNTMLIYPPHTK